MTVSNDCDSSESLIRDKTFSNARRRYSAFVKKSAEDGRKPELVGGGLIRSLGGWSAVKAIRRSANRIKGDERILGDGDFVESVLKVGQERLEHRYELQAKGYDFDWLVSRVAGLFKMNLNEVTRPGRYPATVKARSVLCYWAERE